MSLWQLTEINISTKINKTEIKIKPNRNTSKQTNKIPKGHQNY